MQNNYIKIHLNSQKAVEKKTQAMLNHHNREQRARAYKRQAMLERQRKRDKTMNTAIVILAMIFTGLVIAIATS